MTSRPPDPDALRYFRHWEPVLAGPARRMLERIDADPGVVLDLGTGTGSVAIMASGRWPAARIVGLDASAGMLSVARYRVEVDAPDQLVRFEWQAADAASLPLEAASVDVTTSAFMLQLVEDRRTVLAEAYRVLRPGGTFGMVTWLAEQLSMPADDAYEDVIAESDLGEPEDGVRPPSSTDYERPEDARDELVAAGFESVELFGDELRYRWTRETYLDFKRDFDDVELFEELDESDAVRLIERVTARWATLPDEAFEISGPLVGAVARKAG